MKRYVTASALAIVAMAGQAWADVTPQQVWDDFEAYMSNFGYELTATEVMDGSNLTVTDMTMVVTIPEEDGAVRVVMPDITFADAGDGSVNVTYPEVGDIKLYFVEDGDEVVGEIFIEMTQSNMVMNVSGAVGDMTYTYSGDSLGLELTRVYGVEDGEEIGRDVISAGMTMGPLAGTSRVLHADGLRRIEQDMSLGALALNINFDDPDGDDAGAFSMAWNGVTSAGTTVIPDNLDLDDPTSMFKNGGGVDALLKHTGGQTDFSLTESMGTTVGKLTSSGGEFGFAVSEEALIYALSATDQTVALQGPEIPLPIQAALGEAGFALEMPLSPSETPQPATLSLVLGDFTMADMLWNIFDPAQVLPRDPATVAFNVEAMVTPFLSLLDTEAMEKMAMEGGIPGELNSVTLSDLVVDVVGATLLGSGAFTFDNTDWDTFGFPRPSGKLELQASGVNGLIDNLVAMGLLPEEEAMGARMGMMMLAVPGDEDDTLKSTLEINDQGHILANGQRIQ